MLKKQGPLTVAMGSEEKIKKIKLADVPVWLRLPLLRLGYFNNTLNRIGNIVEKPLFMDRATTSQTRVAIPEFVEK